MTKVIGIDLGTDSIGWAIQDRSLDNKEAIVNYGVRIFQKGVGEEKNVEYSLAAERTGKRSVRRHYFRRKMRKYRTLRVLLENGMCPLLPEELEEWAQYKKGVDFKYPQSQEFQQWINLDPYQLRADGADPSKTLSKMEIGRALYHICQRRGYASNRKDQNQDERTKTDVAIKQLKESMEDKTLGQYFNSLDPHAQRYRTTKTGRKLLYDEFIRICQVQKLDEDLAKDIFREVFFQRPLKSQKQNIGKCPYEKNKYRCNLSHPLFELFRMHSFINTIKYKEIADEDAKMVFLSKADRELIAPLFFRKKLHFEFEDIIKTIEKHHNPNRNTKKGKNDPNLFIYNYKSNLNVSGCPTCADLNDVFGEDWLNYKISRDDFKIDIFEIWNILHSYEDDEKLVEFAQKRLNFDDDQAEKFAKIRLKEGYASLSLKAIRKILPFLEKGLLYSHAAFLANMPEIVGHEKWAKLSEQISDEIYYIIDKHTKEKKNIDIVNTVLSKMRNSKDKNFGQKYELNHQDKQELKATAEIEYGLKRYNGMSDREREKLITDLEYMLLEQIRKAPNGEFLKQKRIDERIVEYLSEPPYNIPVENFEKLYHPSDIEIFPAAKPTLIEGNEYYLLGSPQTPSVRNPMAMRALHELRALLNELILSGQIDPKQDSIVVEMSRELNDANRRRAIQLYQKDLENNNKKYNDEIIKLYKEATGLDIIPTETDILKYQLWEEQKRQCIYTGKTIGITEFLGNNPDYDIEHTLPRSKSFDNSQANKTLADSYYNREIKKNKLPVELPNYKAEVTINIDNKKVDCPAILQVIEMWREKAEEFDDKAEIQRRIAKSATTKEQKDKAISYKHYYTMHKDYWQNKHDRFTMTEIKEGFKNSQLVDTGIITKYALQYLKTIFSKVVAVKGSVTAELRKAWGLQDVMNDNISEGTAKKDRSEHSHHAIDAIVITYLDKRSIPGKTNYYDEIAKSFRENDENRVKTKVTKFPHPWPTFVQDIMELKDSILISHKRRDNTLKQTKRKLKKNNIIQYTDKIDADGNRIPKYEQGRGIRAEINQETYYGAILRHSIDKKTGKMKEEIRYRKSIPVNNISESDINNIVDNKIREKFIKELNENGLKYIKDGNVMLEPNLSKNPDGKPRPIKKIKVYANKVSPSILKEHTHISKKEHKRYYVVQNGGNYGMAIYRGVDSQNNELNSNKILTNIELAEQIRNNTLQDAFPNTIQVEDKRKQLVELEHYCTLKSGNLVLMYSESPDEIPIYKALENNETVNIKELPMATRKEIKLRLFRLIKMSVPNNLVFGRHHFANIKADADLPVKDLTQDDGKVIRCNSNTFKGIPVTLDITGTFISKNKYL